jgi:hypothetical protein
MKLASAAALHSKQEAVARPASAIETTGKRSSNPSTPSASNSTAELAPNSTAEPAVNAAAAPAPSSIQAPAAEMARIELPPDGRPRASVLVESAYMSGHIVATMYLKIGVPKDWMLEYWIPGGHCAGCAVALLMLRPPVKIPSLAETLLVRGRLTAEGHVEQLCLLGRGEFTGQNVLFEALGQWKFRPAVKSGNPVAVEILLVIPRQPD